MSGPGVEGVLGRHQDYRWEPKQHQFVCFCDAPIGDSYPGPAHRAHVAAAVRAEVRAWLGSEVENERAAEAWGKGRTGRAALAALAECVGVEEVGA